MKSKSNFATRFAVFLPARDHGPKILSVFVTNSQTPTPTQMDGDDVGEFFSFAGNSAQAKPQEKPKSSIQKHLIWAVAGIAILRFAPYVVHFSKEILHSALSSRK